MVMRIVRPTPGMRWLGGLLFLLPILAVMQVYFIAGLEYWRVPLAAVMRAALIAFPLVLVFRRLLFSASVWTRPFWMVFLAFWILWVASMAAVEFKIHLGFFVILLSCYGYLWQRILREELASTCLDAGVSWFESNPALIPGVKCNVGGRSLSVARLDENGAFLYFLSPAALLSISFGPEPLEFGFLRESDGQVVNVLGEVVRAVHPRKGDTSLSDEMIQGIGVRFIESQLDRLKSLGDFVEQLRGRGYGN